jgi:hypothetical protein
LRDTSWFLPQARKQPRKWEFTWEKRADIVTCVLL